MALFGRTLVWRAARQWSLGGNAVAGAMATLPAAGTQHSWRAALGAAAPATESLFAVPARTLKPGKSHRGARARFSRMPGATSLGGMFSRARAGKRHLNVHKTSSRLSRLSSPALVSRADASRIRKLMGV
jgi:large subunit ribosomal protein L35